MRRWRRGWDSNPRLSFPNTRFPSVLLKPLGHLSVFIAIRLAQSQYAPAMLLPRDLESPRRACRGYSNQVIAAVISCGSFRAPLLHSVQVRNEFRFGI